MTVICLENLSKRRLVARAVLRRGVWLALLPAALGLGVPGTAKAQPENDEGGVTFELGGMDVTPMAIRQTSTLRDDFVIRISNAGFNFLAAQIQLILNGWVRSDRLAADAPNAILPLVNGFLMGYKFGFNESGIQGCIMMLNRNNDNGDGTTCVCNDAGTYRNLNPPWPDSAVCANCIPGSGANNPLINTGHGGCTGANRAVMRDPFNPEDPNSYTWCKGPFYDYSIVWSNQRADPDCYRRNNDAAGYCPNLNTGQTCNGVCDSWNATNNDIQVRIDNDTAGNQLLLYLRLRNIDLDAWAYADLIGCDYCLWGQSQWSGRLARANALNARASIRFVNGYGPMCARDGEPHSGGGSSTTSSSGGSTSSSFGGGKGSCSVGGGSSTTSSGGASICPTTPGALNSHPLVGIGMGLDYVNIEGNATIYSNDSGMCRDQGWACDALGGIVGTFLSLLSGIVNNLVTGLLEGILEDELRDLIVDLLEEELGLPIDFQMLLADGRGLAKEVCALRMPNASQHSLGWTCSHTHPNTGNVHGRGTCPCDDYDNDGVLNYQDPTPFGGISPPSMTGCPFGTWCGAWADGERYYSWHYGLMGSLGGLEGTDAPFVEIGAYADDYWDNSGLNLLVDFAMVPYRRHPSGGASDNYSDLYNSGHQGYYPDPDGPSGRGPFWNAAAGFQSRSCYPQANLFLNPQQRNFAMGSAARQGAPYPAGFLQMLDDWDGASPGGSHFNFLLSQQFIQELMYAFYFSGMLCIEVNRDTFSFLEDILRVENFKALIPMLGDVNGSGSYIWDQDGYVEIRLIPSDVPVARVLGRRPGCFPAGDQIAPSTIYNVHGELTDHNPVGSCSSPPGVTFKNVYDLLLYLPQLKIEFSAPQAGSGTRVNLFRMNWDAGLAIAAEYNATSVAPGGNVWGGNQPGYFEFLIDGFLGCGGTLFGNSAVGNWQSFNITTFGYGAPTCGIEQAPGGPTLGELQNSISGFLHGLLNSAFSAVLKTQVFLAGLNVDFYRLGYANPAALDPLLLDSDPVGDYGRSTPDLLTAAGRFRGNVSFSALIGILGGIGAPSIHDTRVESRIVPLGGEGGGLRPASASEPLELTPAQSRRAGFRTTNSRVGLDLVLEGFLDPDKAGETVQYSYRLNGGIWHPFRQEHELLLPWLADGRHSLEVRARIGGAIVEQDPSRVEFWVDSLAPDIFLYDHADRWIAPGSEQPAVVSALVIDVEDNISASDEVLIEYRFGDGAWRVARHGRVDLSEVQDGSLQVLEVRARDEFGNVSEARYPIQAVPGGAFGATGCGLTIDGGSAANPLLLLALMLGGWWFARRRSGPEGDRS